VKIHFVPILSAVLLAGCSPGAITTSEKDAVEVVQRMVFVKQEKTGLCFGIVSSASINPHGASTSMSATLVPCSSVEAFLVNDKNKNTK
jgi:hypothetical protein